MARPSREQIVSETAKCRKSFSYFANEYVTILHPRQGFIPFKLYDFQERIHKDFLKHRFNIIKKPRQMGLSTLTSVYLLWLALFNPASEIMIISIGARESKEFLKHIKIAFDRLPPWLCGKLVSDNKSTMEFDNNSRIQSIPSPRYAARSFSASILVIDEAAFIQNIESLWTSAFPILSTGGKAIVLSTVNGTYGAGNWFYTKWIEAEQNLNNFNPISLHYMEHPEYCKDGWAEAQRKDLGELKFSQEVLCDFLGSVNTFISREIINKYVDLEKTGKTPLRDPIEKRMQDMLWIWTRPVPGNYYIMGVDVAKQGQGKSNSAFHIFDISTCTQVAEFCGKVDTINYAKIINDIGKEYNNSYVVLEINNMGLAVMNELYFNLQYNNVYFRRTGNPGWETTAKTRPFIIQSIEQVFSKDILKIVSKRTINELQTFVADLDTGKVQKSKGSTDDLLISLGLAYIGLQFSITNNPALAALYGKQEEDNLLVNAFVQLKQDVGPIRKGTRGVVVSCEGKYAIVSFLSEGNHKIDKDNLELLKNFNDHDLLRWSLKEDPWLLKIDRHDGIKESYDLRWLVG